MWPKDDAVQSFFRYCGGPGCDTYTLAVQRCFNPFDVLRPNVGSKADYFFVCLGLVVGLQILRCSGEVHSTKKGAKCFSVFADKLYTVIGEHIRCDAI